MASNRSLRFTIEVDDRGSATLRSFVNGLERVDTASKRAEGGFSRMGARIVTLEATISLLTRGMLALERTVAATFGSIIEEAERVQVLSRRLQVSTQALQAFDYVAKQVGGVSSQSLAFGIRAMNKALVEAGTAGTAANKLLVQTFGFTRQQLALYQRDSVAALLAITDQFNRYADGAKKSVAAGALFGGRAQTFLTLAKEGGPAIRQLLEQAKALNLVWSDAKFTAAERFGDAVTMVGEAWRGFKSQLIGSPELMSTLSGILERTALQLGRLARSLPEQELAAFQRALGEGLEKLAQWGIATLPKIVQAIPTIVSGLEQVAVTAGKIAAFLSTPIGAATVGGVVGVLFGAPAGAAAGLTLYGAQRAMRSPQTQLDERVGNLQRYIADTEARLTDSSLGGRANRWLGGIAGRGSSEASLLQGLANAQRELNDLRRQRASGWTPPATGRATSLSALNPALGARYGSAAAARRWVAPPGRSQHNHGLAADLSFHSQDARTWAHENAAQFGLTFPMGHEPWHIEPSGARRGRTPGAAAGAGLPELPGDLTNSAAETQKFVEKLRDLKSEVDNIRRGMSPFEQDIQSTAREFGNLSAQAEPLLREKKLAGIFDQVGERTRAAQAGVAALEDPLRRVSLLTDDFIKQQGLVGADADRVRDAVRQMFQAEDAQKLAEAMKTIRDRTAEAKAEAMAAQDPYETLATRVQNFIRDLGLVGDEAERIRPEVEAMFRAENAKTIVEETRKWTTELENLRDPAGAARRELEETVMQARALGDTRLEGLIRQAAETKDQLAAFDTITGTFGGALDKVVEGFLLGTRSMDQALGALKSTVLSITKDMIAAIAKAVLMKALLGTPISSTLGGSGSLLGAVSILFGGGSAGSGGGGGGALSTGLTGVGFLGKVAGLFGFGGTAAVASSGVTAASVAGLPAGATILVPGGTAGIAAASIGSSGTAGGVSGGTAAGAAGGSLAAGAAAAGIGAAIVGAIVNSIGYLQNTNSFPRSRGYTVDGRMTFANQAGIQGAFPMVASGQMVARGEIGMAVLNSALPTIGQIIAAAINKADRRDFQAQLGESIVKALERAQVQGQRRFAQLLGPDFGATDGRMFRGPVTDNGALAFGAAVAGMRGGGGKFQFARNIAGAAQGSELDILDAFRALGLYATDAVDSINRTFDGGRKNVIAYERAVRGVITTFTGLDDAAAGRLRALSPGGGKFTTADIRQIVRAGRQGDDIAKNAFGSSGGDVASFAGSLATGIGGGIEDLLGNALFGRGGPLRGLATEPLAAVRQARRGARRRNSDGGRRITTDELTQDILPSALAGVDSIADRIGKNADLLRKANEVGLKFTEALALAAGDYQAAADAQLALARQAYAAGQDPSAYLRDAAGNLNAKAAQEFTFTRALLTAQGDQGGLGNALLGEARRQRGLGGDAAAITQLIREAARAFAQAAAQNFQTDLQLALAQGDRGGAASLLLGESTRLFNAGMLDAAKGVAIFAGALQQAADDVAFVQSILVEQGRAAARGEDPARAARRVLDQALAPFVQQVEAVRDFGLSIREQGEVLLGGPGVGGARAAIAGRQRRAAILRTDLENAQANGAAPERILDLAQEYASVQFDALSQQLALARQLRDTYEGIRDTFKGVREQIDVIRRGPRAQGDILARRRAEIRELQQIAMGPEGEARDRALARLAQLVPEALSLAGSVFAPGSSQYQEVLAELDSASAALEGLATTEIGRQTDAILSAEKAIKDLMEQLGPVVDALAQQATVDFAAEFSRLSGLLEANGLGAADYLAAIARTLGSVLRPGGNGGTDQDPDPQGERDNQRMPRQRGGVVFPGQAYLVGERGPETFVPTRAGTILPTGSGMAINLGGVHVTVAAGATPEAAVDAVERGLREKRPQLVAAMRQALGTRSM